MADDFADRLRRKLSPDSMTLALVRAGTLLTGYELLKTAVVDDVRNFHTLGLDNPSLQQRYESEVLMGSKYALEASLAWLVRNEAITSEQAQTVELVRAQRNLVGHELAHLLIDPDAGVEVDLLRRLYDLVVALDRFWGPIHIDSNPDFDGREVAPDDYFSGTRLLLGLLVQLAQVDVDEHADDDPGLAEPRSENIGNRK